MDAIAKQSKDTPSPFGSWQLNGLTVRNRIIKTATFEGLTPDGRPGEKLAAFSEKYATGGAGIVTVAYGAVNADARTFDDQMCMKEDIIDGLRKVTDRIHGAGAVASIQLAHCGMQTKYSKLSTKPFSLGASRGINVYGLFGGIPFIRPMSEDVINTIAADYGYSAKRAVEAGFDIIELHLGHGYLFSQFLCPAVNKRKDKFGGSLENRLRFPMMALRSVRQAIGSDVPVLVKINVADGFKGGLSEEDAIEVAKTIDTDGSASMIVLTGGFSSKNPMYFFRGESPIKPLIAVQKSFINRMVYTLAARHFPSMPFEEMYFLKQARKIRSAVKMPVALVGGIKSLGSMKTVMKEGFDAIVMGRALIHDPDLVNKYEKGAASTSGCTSCNRCVAGIDSDEGVICPLTQEEISKISA